MKPVLMAMVVGLSLAGLAAPCPPKGPASPQPAVVPERFHYVFILDTSASMMGLGDGKGRVIFPHVKRELKRFAEQIPPGSRITVQPFDAGPGVSRTFSVPEEKEAFLQYLESLKATGSQTYLYRTLLSVLDRLEKLRRPNEAYSVYVFTDGRDNDPGPYTIHDVTKRYQLRRGPYDWLFYISLGISAPKEVLGSLAAVPNARVLEAPPNEVPTLSEVVLRPARLDLGNLWGKGQAERDIQIETKGAASNLSLATEIPALEQAGAFLQISPQALPARDSVTLSFRLRNGESLAPGTYEGWLCVNAPSNTVVRPQVIPVRFAFHPPGEYTLVPVAVPEKLELSPGESATLSYRVQGNAWAKEAVTVNVKTPKGLEATLNGQPGPAQVQAGEELTIALKNTGLGAGVTQAPRLEVVAPQGSVVQAPETLPPVSQPMTLWDWLNRFWWLALLLLLLLLGLLWWLWRSQQPWATATFVSSPEKGCQEQKASLRGRVDVGQVFREETLQGVEIGQKNGRPYLLKLPPHVSVYEEGRIPVNLEDSRGEPLDWKTTYTFKDAFGKKELGSLSLNRR